MRVLVYPTDLTLGGAAINALDLAAAVRDRGHEVLVFAPPGELDDALAERDLPFAPALPHPRRRVALGQVRRLRQVRRRFRPDVVHTWEFAAGVNAFLALRLPSGVGHLATVMSMRLSPFVPRFVPMTMGTKDLCEGARRARPGPVWLLEPPLDAAAELVSGGAAEAFRRELGIGPGEPLVVIVSRLSPMKWEGIADTIAAVGLLGTARLVIVGDGEALHDARRLADDTNAAAGRRAVVLAGARLDPRPAYGAADVVVGMGSSALRGMAAGKPVVVVGLGGFCRRVDPGTWSHFDRHGMWGVGGSDRPQRLAHELRRLLEDPGQRAQVGVWGRRLVAERYDLAVAADHLVQLYERSVGRPRAAGEWADGVRVAVGNAALPAGRAVRKLRRRG